IMGTEQEKDAAGIPIARLFKMRGLIIAFLVFCPSFPALAFLFGPDVDDVRVSSIEVIDHLKRTNNMFRSNFSKLLFMIKFTTSVNLRRIARNYSVFNDAFLCDQGILDQEKKLWSDPYVYDKEWVSACHDEDPKHPCTDSISFEYKIYTNLQ